jgi:hypothetical protein
MGIERSETHPCKHRSAQAPSAQPPRHAKDEDQHLRHRLVEIERYFLADPLVAGAGLVDCATRMTSPVVIEPPF